MKSLHIIFVLFIAALMQGSMAAQSASGISFSTKPTPFDAYAAATQDTLPRLEPYFRAYKEAAKKGDKIQQEAMLHQIVLRNTLENWRWQFYQYGLQNEQKLSDRERAVWKMVNTMFVGRTAPPNPEHMLGIPPEQIRQSIIREKEEFNKTLTAFDSGYFKLPYPDRMPIGKKPQPATITSTSGVQTTLAPPAATPDQQPKSAASPTAKPESSPIVQTEPSKSFPWPWIVGAILLFAIVGGVLLKFRRK
jgi:hypothetical protein